MKKGSGKTKAPMKAPSSKKEDGDEDEGNVGDEEEDIAEIARKNTASQAEKARQNSMKASTTKKKDPLLSKLKAATTDDES
jgi:hypothetical protein